MGIGASLVAMWATMLRLPKKSVEADASTKSRQGKKAEGASQAREAQLHHFGGVT
jgi:hypothetical protein